MPGVSLPFGFGGDGAGALMLDEDRAQAAIDLIALRRVSQARFGLALRVVMMSVAGPILVGKNLLEGQCPWVVFLGGALSAANTLIKRPFERDVVADVLESQTALWMTISSTHGWIFSFLASVPNGHERGFHALLSRVRARHGHSSWSSLRVSGINRRATLQPLATIVDPQTGHGLVQVGGLHMMFASQNTRVECLK